VSDGNTATSRTRPNTLHLGNILAAYHDASRQIDGSGIALSDQRNRTSDYHTTFSTCTISARQFCWTDEGKRYVNWD